MAVWNSIKNKYFKKSKKKPKRIVVIGDFAEGKKVYSGQTAKVRDYYYFLKKKFGEEYVFFIDTSGWKKKIMEILLSVICDCFKCEKIVLLLCGDGYGIKICLPIFLFLKKITRNKIYFSVIGGGLLNNYDKRKVLKKQFKQLNAIYVETKTMQKFLKNRGHNNVYYAPVFSKRKGVSIDKLDKQYNEPFLLCTYSRVIKEKGISDAIDAVNAVNKRANRIICLLDIYGPPIGNYVDEFNQKIAESSGSVRNHPLLEDKNAIQELSKHYLMLFPTYYSGEGFPIALIECMKAGLPVIATDWHFNSELIDNDKTGLIYNRKEKNKLSEFIEKLINDPCKVYEMKKNCIKKSFEFEPDVVLQHLYKELELC